MKPLIILFASLQLFFIIPSQAQIGLEIQQFNISPQKDTTLYGKRGAEIFIPKYAFQDKQDSIIKEGVVEIGIKEVYNKSDMVFENISTVSKEGILVSNGMIYISASYGEDSLELQSGKSIDIRIPSFSGINGMGLFRLGENEDADWQVLDQLIKMDTWQNFRQSIIWDYKEISQKEYKAQLKREKNAPPRKTKETQGDQTRTDRYDPTWYKSKDHQNLAIFRDETGKYLIPIAKDTCWVCAENHPAYYLFSVAQIGWYNIDKLKNFKLPIRVRVKTEKELNLFLVLADEKVCIKGTKTSFGDLFPKVPQNVKGYLIAYHLDGEHHVQGLIQEIRTSLTFVELDELNQIQKGVFYRMIENLKE